MPSTVTCPSEHDLQQLLLGQMSDAQAEPLEEHLQGCDRCLETASKLHVQDTLAQVVRAQAGVVEIPTGELVANLMERLEALRPTMAVSPQEVTVAAEGPVRTSSPSPLPGSTTQVMYDFLEAPQAPDELGRLGPYRIQKVLGAGGMGVVFQAEDPHLGRRVALKVMLPSLLSNPAARQRFLREAQAVAAIEHDHIVAIHQVGEEGGIPFLAMPLLKGESLEERLMREGKLPVDQVLRIGREVAEGLAAAHARGLIHRDIKPANLWLEGGEGMHADSAAPADFKRVKILDFGLARPAGDSPQITQPGAIVGSPAYMAPEQTRAGSAVDARADLFSLGCLLYRAATGELPFKGDDTMSILTSLALDDPPAPYQLDPHIPPALSDLIMQLLAKKPGDRIASAQEVMERIQGGATRERMRPESEKTASSRSRSRLARIAIAAAVLLGGLATWQFGPAIYRFVTDQGVVIIETKADDVQVTVRQGGEVIEILDPQTHRQVTLHAGQYQLELPPEQGARGLTLKTNEFTLERGGRVIVEVKVEPVVRKTTASGEARVFHVFHSSARTLTQDGVTSEEGAWRISGNNEGATRQVRLFEVPVKDLDDCTVILRASMKSASLTGRAYLEMWCHFADGQEYFSKGTQNPIQGTTGWSSYQIPFFLKPGQLPDLLKLNVVIEGKGTVWIKDLKLLRAPLPSAADRQPPPHRVTVSPITKAIPLPSPSQGERRGNVADQDDVPLKGNAWRVVAKGPRRVLLRETAQLDGAGWGSILLTCRAEMKTQNVKGRAYLELQCHLPGGKTFTSGVENNLEGTNDWKSVGTTIHLEKGQIPSQIQVRVVVEGTGTVWAQDVELRSIPMLDKKQVEPHASPRPLDQLPLRGRASPAGAEIRRFQGHAKEVTGVRFAPDGKRAYSSSKDGTVRSWELVTGRLLWLAQVGQALALDVSPDGRTLLVGVLDAGDFAGAMLLDSATGKVLRRFPMGETWCMSVAFSREGCSALVVGLGRTFVLWNTETGQELKRFDSPGRTVTCVTFAPSGKLAASASDREDLIRLWDIRRGSATDVLETPGRRGSKGGVHALAFSPDGTLLLSAGADGDVWLWDLTLARPARSFIGNVSQINSVAFSPDGKRALSGGAGASVRLWDVATGKELAYFGTGSAVLSVAFSPDGRLVLYGGADGSLHLWQLP
jgi:serine/threonine protein kinase